MSSALHCSVVLVVIGHLAETIEEYCEESSECPVGDGDESIAGLAHPYAAPCLGIRSAEDAKQDRASLEFRRCRSLIRKQLGGMTDVETE